MKRHVHPAAPWPHPATVWYHVAEAVMAVVSIGVIGWLLFVWLP
ncbi:MAG: hypothetical protein Q8Q29_03655 [Actinomycetota bacterium]|nr:hypothetical protein [Actinomycetota bacterium]